MEYKLNKIDTELISRVNRAARPGKIHKEKTVKFNLDKNKDEKENKYKTNAYKKKEQSDIKTEDRKEDGTGKYIYVRK